MDLEALKQDLIRDEKLVLKPYRDTVGKWTVGVGRNLSDVGITKEEAEFLLINDIGKAMSDLDRACPWWQHLDPVRQRVLCNMAFNMGIGRLLGFKYTLHSIEMGEYEAAAKLMSQSLWATQVGPRAKRLEEMMRTGRAPASVEVA